MLRDPTMSWMVKHFNDNPGHTVRETLELPPYCETCGAKSPMYDLRVTAKDGTDG